MWQLQSSAAAPPVALVEQHQRNQRTLTKNCNAARPVAELVQKVLAQTQLRSGSKGAESATATQHVQSRGSRRRIQPGLNPQLKPSKTKIQHEPLALEGFIRHEIAVQIHQGPWSTNGRLAGYYNSFHCWGNLILWIGN